MYLPCHPVPKPECCAGSGTLKGSWGGGGRIRHWPARGFVREAAGPDSRHSAGEHKKSLHP